MKKLLLIIIVLFGFLSLCSCSLVGRRVTFENFTSLNWQIVIDGHPRMNLLRGNLKQLWVGKRSHGWSIVEVRAWDSSSNRIHRHEVRLPSDRNWVVIKYGITSDGSKDLKITRVIVPLFERPLGE